MLSDHIVHPPNVHPPNVHPPKARSGDKVAVRTSGLLGVGGGQSIYWEEPGEPGLAGSRPCTCMVAPAALSVRGATGRSSARGGCAWWVSTSVAVAGRLRMPVSKGGVRRAARAGKMPLAAGRELGHLRLAAEQLPPAVPIAGAATGSPRPLASGGEVVEGVIERPEAVVDHVVGIRDHPSRSEQAAGFGVDGRHPLGRQPVQGSSGEHRVHAGSGFVELFGPQGRGQVCQTGPHPGVTAEDAGRDGQ